MGKGERHMRLKNLRYAELAEKIKREQKRIIVYGAGVIGQIVVPDVMKKFGLVQNLLFFVDADPSKQTERIEIGDRNFEIKSIEALRKYCKADKNIVLLITNSRLCHVIKSLDEMEELDETETYIIPIMQIQELTDAQNEEPIQMAEKPLIPKVIHYCWFSGNEMPDELKRCVESWRKYCPDYEIRRWDESNYDVSKNLYMKQAYEHKKWGFIPDFARLDILYSYGGIYMDTDVELIRNLDALRYQQAFCGVEKWGVINMGGCSGSVKHHPMLKKLLEERRNIRFVRSDGSLNLEASGVYDTMPFIRKGLDINNKVQRIQEMTVYSSDFFIRMII